MKNKSIISIREAELLLEKGWVLKDFKNIRYRIFQICNEKSKFGRAFCINKDVADALIKKGYVPKCT